MKRSRSQKSQQKKQNKDSKSKSKSNSKSKSKSKVKLQKGKSQEEEKKQQPKQAPILGPVIYTAGDFHAAMNRQNGRQFDIVRVSIFKNFNDQFKQIAQDFRAADASVSVLFFEQDQNNQNQKARSINYVRDIVNFPNTTQRNENEIFYKLDVKIKKKKNNDINDPANIKKTEIKRTYKSMKAHLKGRKFQDKVEKQQEKEQKAKEKEDLKIQKLMDKEQQKQSKNIKQIKPAEDVPAKKQQVIKRQKIEPLKKTGSTRAERATKRAQHQDSDQDDDEEEKQINTDANNNAIRKRDMKAKVKAQAKQKVIKKKEPEQVREEVEIPDLVRTKEDPAEELFLECCQSCSNRNCMRAVKIGSAEMFEKCIQSKAYITSLMEHQSPEIRYSALEMAIRQNNHQIIEMIFSQDRPEEEIRMKKKEAQIAKFDTGEVSKLAFGVKVRKVNIMRGNRQGNNAFLEDSKHIWKTPVEYLFGSDYCMSKIFAQDTVTIETIDVLRQVLGKQAFHSKFLERALPDILRQGCYQALLGIFKVFNEIDKDQGKEDPSVSIFNKVFYQLLTFEDVKDITLTKQDIVRANLNTTYKPAHIAALNPSGAGLLFIRSQGEEIDVKFKKLSTAHFASVCNTTKNLQILIDEQKSLFEQDEHNMTPLHWAIKAAKPAANITMIMEDLDYQFHKDSKDDHKKMPIHYAAQYYGGDKVQVNEVMDLMLANKAKMSMVGGWDKYTPLEYAATNGQTEVVQYFLENVPRLNINKGDKYSRSPLVMACRNGHAKIVALLIKHNAEMNKPDTSGNTPLHHAAAYGWLECVNLLLKYGADPSPENAWKTTPIVIALQKNHLGIVKELINVKDDKNANIKDDEGRTLLILAMANINMETADFVTLLLTEKQADPNLQDAKGRTALFHLVQNMTLKQRGLFQDHDDLEYKVVKILLSSGANVNIKSKDGKSPFTLAFEHGNEELLNLFGCNVDLNQDPTLFFSLTGSSILKIKTHELLTSFINQKRLEDETINYVNDNGFTPFLFYINEFSTLYYQAQSTIEGMLAKKEEVINNETIVNSMKKQDNGAVVFSVQAKAIFKKEIAEPFIEFIKVLLQNGANPNAYILKLKPYRDDQHISSTQTQPQLSQLSSQVQAQILARRPPEKDQYLSEKLGLSSVIHLLINKQNSLDVFDYIMKIQGLELNQVNFQKMTPFFELVKTKDIKQDNYFRHYFERLLQSEQVDINAPDQFGSSAFWFFYTNKRYDEAMYLVDQGANINHMDNYGEFALKRELFAGNLELIQKLLVKGANPNQQDEFGRTVLHLACNMAHRKDMKEIINLFVKYNANLQCEDFKQRTPIYYMYIRKNRRYEIDQFEALNNGIKLLINDQTKDTIDISHQDVNGKTLLHYLAQRGCIDSLDYFIQVFGIENIQFSLLDKIMNTPLSVAINFKHYKFVEKLLDLEVVNMKGFIYDEIIKQAGHNPLQNQQNQFQQVQNDNNEQSDFEFMEVQQSNPNNVLGNFQAKKHNKEEALNIFRYIIRHNLVDLEKAFISHGYDKIQMVIDYICEGQINKLFEVIEKHFKAQAGAKGSILIQKNEKQQNLIHVLARNSHRIKDIGESSRFYKQLLDEGVDPLENDYKGRSALQLAIMSGNIHFIKFLITVQNFDVQHKDNRGGNAITTLLKGDRILKANAKILEFLIAQGCDCNTLYQEQSYEDEGQINDKNNHEEEKVSIHEMNGVSKQQGKVYRTTCVIHAIRHESKERQNIQEILKILLKNSNLSILDSTGRDAFMYIAMRNHSNTFNFIMDSLKEDEIKDKVIVVKDNVDIENGKSFIHYIVNPLSFGSYENKDLLYKALNYSFVFNIKDKKGNTPYQYACQQKSGVLKKVFETFTGGNIKDLTSQLNKDADQEMNIDDLIQNDKQSQNLQKKFNIDFEKDAHEYLLSIQMQIDPQNSVPCDPSGKFNEDCEVMFDTEGTEQHFDVYLTRVEIGKFQPGGDYLFYRMQLVWDRAREFCILLTRWGRIGEEGAFQKTPFNNREDGIEEFRKIFEQKTNNKWCPKDKFQKKFRKFQLMRTNYITIDQRNFLLPFTNLEMAPVLKQCDQESIEVFREICDVNTYLKALHNSGVDLKAMPFSNLHRQNLYDALAVLQKLEKTIEKLETLNPRPYAENERNTLLSLREKMWFLSGRFYEQIPHEEFRNKMVPPISTQALLAQKSQMLQNLIDIEMASKILLGAHFKKEEFNPLEYCIIASGINIQTLDKRESEFKLIEEYVNNTNIDQKGRSVVRILKLNREADDLKFKHDLDNRVLLFHGSRVSNFLSILSQGLRIQPIQVKRQGNLLGKGLYFTDTFSKAFTYTADLNAPNHSSKFILLCEVALGETKQMMRFSNDYKIEEGFNSVQGVGRQGPEKKKFITLPDGAKIPYGKSQVYPVQGVGAVNDFQFNEFVVNDYDQVRFRYLIQVK